MQAFTRIVGIALLAGLLGWTLGCEQPTPSGRAPETPTTPKAESPPTAEQTTPETGEPQPRETPGAEAAAAPEEIDILCGTSFGPPMEKLVKRYKEATGGDAILIFGGSEDHLPKVKLKSGGDVYVTHTPYIQYTREAGALLREIPVGFLAPVLVVQKGNPKGLKRIEDLARPGLKVVLTSPEYSTCGEMVFALLEKKGIKDAVMENVGNDLVKHHATVGNHLQLKARDAGIMWNGIANNFRDVITIVPIPYEYDEIRVAVLGLSYTEKKESVERFLDFIAKHGREVFAEFGYTKVEPESDESEPKSEPPAEEPLTGQAASEAAAAEPAAAEPDPSGRLLLFCGAGLRPPVAEAVERFHEKHGTTIECDYAGTGVLIARIKLSGKGDLYLPGDVHYVNLAAEQGLVRSQQTVCYFVPVIMVRKGNPKSIRSLQDLTREGIKLGLGDPKACAVGRTASKIFEKNGIDEQQLAVAYRSGTVNELGNHVKLGTLDAAIVWDAVAAQFGDDVEPVAIPVEQNEISTVAVGVLGSSEDPRTAAAFVAFLTSPEGRAVFRKHHYTVESPF